MDQFERTYRERFFAIAACGACVLLVFVWLFVGGVISLQGFAAATLIWSLTLGISVYLLIRSMQRKAEDLRRQRIASGIPVETLDRERCLKNIRSCMLLIAALALFLVYGLFTSQGDPILASATGAGINLMIIGVCTYSIIRSRRRLRELSAGEAKSRTES